MSDLVILAKTLAYSKASIDFSVKSMGTKIKLFALISIKTLFVKNLSIKHSKSPYVHCLTHIKILKKRILSNY